MYTNKAFSNFKKSAFLLYKAVVKSILKFSKGEVFILTIQKVFGIDYSTCCFHYRNFPNDGDHLPPIQKIWYIYEYFWLANIKSRQESSPSRHRWFFIKFTRFWLSMKDINVKFLCLRWKSPNKALLFFSLE